MGYGQALQLDTPSDLQLFDLYNQDIASYEVSQLQFKNQQFIFDYNRHVPIQTQRAQSMTRFEAQQILDITLRHPVVGYNVKLSYQHEGIETGYCFGRAMYLHLLSLKMGLQKESIKKIWAVGTMVSDVQGVNWGYHVALSVFSKEEGWLVIDPLQLEPVTVAEWVQSMTDRSVDKKIVFYMTEASKFGPTLAGYQRGILGLDMKPADDWFKGYFVDLLKATREESLEALHLKKIDIQKSYLYLNQF